MLCRVLVVMMQPTALCETLREVDWWDSDFHADFACV